MTYKNCLTQEILQELLKYNPDTGEFTWRETGGIAGHITKHGYRSIMINYENWSAHRLAFLYMTGAFPEHQVDHKDMDRGNNKWSNLRPATNAQNNQNRPSKNYYKQPRGKGFTVYLDVNNKRRYFGTYRDEELAQLVAAEARDKYHGEYARGLQ